MNQAWCLNVSSLVLSRLNYRGLFRFDKNANSVLNWSKIIYQSYISIMLFVYDSFPWSDYQLTLRRCCMHMSFLEVFTNIQFLDTVCISSGGEVCMYMCRFDSHELRIVWNNKEHVPRPWIEHGASRSSVLRSPNWAIEAYVHYKQYIYTWYTQTSIIIHTYH